MKNDSREKRKMKKLITLVLAMVLIFSLSSCGSKDKEDEKDYGPGSNVITSACIDGTYCEFDAYKNPGGQETGVVFKILIPKDKITDKKNVPLEITLAEDWKVSNESNCLKQIDGNKLTLDLSVSDPKLIVKTENRSSRCYHLITE